MNTLKYGQRWTVSFERDVAVVAAIGRLSRRIVTLLVDLSECFEEEESLSFEERLQRTGRIRYR